MLMQVEVVAAADMDVDADAVVAAVEDCVILVVTTCIVGPMEVADILEDVVAIRKTDIRMKLLLRIKWVAALRIVLLAM